MEADHTEKQVSEQIVRVNWKEKHLILVANSMLINASIWQPAVACFLSGFFLQSPVQGGKMLLSWAKVW